MPRQLSTTNDAICQEGISNLFREAQIPVVHLPPFSNSCGVFASFYTEEASQGREIGGCAPTFKAHRGDMLAGILALSN